MPREEDIMEQHYEGSTPKARCFRTFIAFVASIAMALPTSLLGASFVQVEDHFSTGLPWMTSMLSFHITGFLLAKHLATLAFHRLNFDLQLGLAGLLGGGALMLSMYGRNFLGFTAAMALQGLCSGYLQQGIENYISLLWSNHKARKILTYFISVTWLIGSILCPLMIFALFNQGSNLGAPGELIHTTIEPEIQPLPTPLSQIAQNVVPGDVLQGNNTTSGNETSIGTVIHDLGTNLTSGVDTDLSTNGTNIDSDVDFITKLRDIKYVYGFVGAIEMSAGGAFTVLFILLGPSFLRKDSVCMLSTKTNANLIGQPRCFGFGFIVLMTLFCCFYMNTEYFPRYLLSTLAVHNNKMNVAYGALTVSAFEAGILVGRFLSLLSSCVISARILLNIGCFMACLSFLLLLTALSLGDVVMYAAAFSIGISISNIYTHLFQWACNYMVITGLVRWAAVLGSILGCVIGLPIIGFMVKAIGYGVVAYLLLGASLGATVVLVVLQVYAAAARPVMQLSDPTDEELRTFARQQT